MTSRLSKRLEITSYDTAASYMRKGAVVQPVRRRLPGRDTFMVRQTDAYEVQFRGTAVVTFHKDGRIELKTGGHDTFTTKDRINSYTPSSVRLFQKNFKWMIDVGGKVQEFKPGFTFQHIPAGGPTPAAPITAAPVFTPVTKVKVAVKAADPEPEIPKNMKAEEPEPEAEELAEKEPTPGCPCPTCQKKLAGATA